MSDSDSDLDLEELDQYFNAQPAPVAVVEVSSNKPPSQKFKKIVNISKYEIIKFIFPEVSKAISLVSSKLVKDKKNNMIYAVLDNYLELYESLKKADSSLVEKEERVKELWKKLNENRIRSEKLSEKLNADYQQKIKEEEQKMEDNITLEQKRLLSDIPEDGVPDEGLQSEVDSVRTEGLLELEKIKEQLNVVHDQNVFDMKRAQGDEEFSIVEKLDQLIDIYRDDEAFNKKFFKLFSELDLSMKAFENPEFIPSNGSVISEESYMKLRSLFSREHHNKKIITLVPRIKKIAKTWEQYISIAQRAKIEAAAEASAEKAMAGDDGSRSRNRVSSSRVDEDGGDEEQEGYDTEESEEESEEELFGPLDSEDEEEEEKISKKLKKQIEQQVMQPEEEEEAPVEEEEEIVMERKVESVKANRLGFQPREMFMYPEDQLMENIPGICELDPALFNMIQQELVLIRMNMDKVHNIFNKLEEEVYKPFCEFYEDVRPNMMKLLLKRCRNSEFDSSTPLSEIVSCTDEQKFLLKKYLTERTELDIIQELSARRSEIVPTDCVFTNSSIGALVEDIETLTGSKLNPSMLTKQDPLLVEIRKRFIDKHLTEAVSKRMANLLVYLCVCHDTFAETFYETTCVMTATSTGLITPEQFLLIQEWRQLNKKQAEEVSIGVKKAVEYTIQQLFKGEGVSEKHYLTLSESSRKAHDEFMQYYQMSPSTKIILGIPLLRVKNAIFRPGYPVGLINMNNKKNSFSNELQLIRARSDYLENKVKYKEFESKFEELEESLPVFFRYLMIHSFDKTKIIRRPFYLKYLFSQVQNVEQYLFLKYYMEHFPDDFRKQLDDFEIAVLWVKKIMRENFPLVKIIPVFRSHYKKDEDRVESVLDLIFKMVDNAKINDVHQLIRTSSDDLDALSQKFRDLIPESVSLSFPKCEYVFMKHYQDRFRAYFGITFNIPFNGSFGDMKIIKKCLSALRTVESGLLVHVSESAINDLVLKETDGDSDVNPEFIIEIVSFVRQEEVIRILKEESYSPQKIDEIQKRLSVSQNEANVILMLENLLEKYNKMVPVPSEQPLVQSYFISTVVQTHRVMKERGSVLYVKNLSPRLQRIIRKQKSARSSLFLETMKRVVSEKIDRERRMVESPQYADRMTFTCEQIQSHIDSICSKPLRVFTDKKEQKKRIFLLYQLIYEFILIQLRSDIEKERQAIQQEVLARVMGVPVERNERSYVIDKYAESLTEPERMREEVSSVGIQGQRDVSLLLRNVERDVFRKMTVDRYVELYFEKCAQLNKEFSSELPSEIANATLAEISEKRASEVDNDPIIPKADGIRAKFRNEIPYGVVRPTEFIRYAYFARNQSDIPPPITVDQNLVLFMSNAIFLPTVEIERLRQNRSVSSEYIETVVEVDDTKFVKPSLLFMQRLIDTCLIRGDQSIVVDDVPYQLGRVINDQLTNRPVSVRPFTREEYEQLIVICQKRFNDMILGRKRYVKMSVMKPGYYLPVSDTDVELLIQEYKMLERIKQEQLFIPVDKEKRRSALKEMIEAITNNWVEPSYELLKLISMHPRRNDVPLIIDNVEYKFGIFYCDKIHELTNDKENGMISSSDLIQKIHEYFAPLRGKYLEQIKFIEKAGMKAAKIDRISVSPFEGTKHKKRCHVCEKPIHSPYLITLAITNQPLLVWICSSDCSEKFELVNDE